MSKVYGFCDAGCRRRVPTYEEFLAGASCVKLIPFNTSGSGNLAISDFVLPPMHEYKIYASKALSGDVYAGIFRVVITMEDGGTITRSFDRQSISYDAEGYYTCIVGAPSINETTVTIDIQLNGVVNTFNYSNSSAEHFVGVELQVAQVKEVLLVNKDAEIVLSGVNGKSAYEHAVDGGYSGTEIEFATKLAYIMGQPLVGRIDENNVISFIGNVPAGTYTVKYEMEDGSTIDIGILAKDTPYTYTNLFNPALITSDLLNKRVKSDGSIEDCIGHFVVPHILISDKVPFTDSTKIYVKGATFNKTSADNPYAKVLTYKNKAAAGANPYSGEYSGITYNVLGQVDEGNGVISISGDIVRQSFASDIKYVAFVLKVADTAITENDIKDIVITIDEPIG